MSERMTADLVVDAFRMALFRQKRQAPKLVHSDRGSQYASESFRNELKAHGCKQSMRRRGACWDNAVAESFFGTLKTELVHHERYRTREQARLNIFDYIETFYNRRRLHSYLNYVSPEEFETSMETALDATRSKLLSVETGEDQTDLPSLRRWLFSQSDNFARLQSSSGLYAAQIVATTLDYHDCLERRRLMKKTDRAESARPMTAARIPDSMF